MDHNIFVYILSADLKVVNNDKKTMIYSDVMIDVLDSDSDVILENRNDLPITIVEGDFVCARDSFF